MNKEMFFTTDNASVLLKALNSYKHKQIDIVLDDSENEGLKRELMTVIDMEDFLRKVQLTNRAK